MNPNYPDVAIGVAARNGELDEVKRLVASGVDINTPGRGAWTPLHEAASQGYSAVVQWLLENGADVNCKTVVVRGEDAGKSPLHVAVEGGHSDVVKLLVKRGAKIDAKKSNGYTALMTAVSKGRIDIVTMLIEAGAKVRVLGQIGTTALSEAVATNRVAISKLLVEKGADVNQVLPAFKSTLLMEAAQESFPEILALLTSAGGDIHAKDKDGMTALHYAAMKEAVDATKLLLAHGADPSAVDAEGRTPAMIARQYRSREVLQLLEKATRSRGK
jgi:ankyrin repeat protein